MHCVTLYIRSMNDDSHARRNLSRGITINVRGKQRKMGSTLHRVPRYKISPARSGNERIFKNVGLKILLFLQAYDATLIGIPTKPPSEVSVARRL
jgi:hypothetical protein